MTAWDQSLFYWMNGTAVAPWLDPVMLVATSARFWQVTLVILAGILLVRRGGRARPAVLALIMAAAASDIIAGHVLKPLFGRARPCHALEGVRLLVRCGGQNGFPSNHAANAAAIAAALGVFFPRSLAVTLPLALLVAWSRVYVGVHYPADVLAGLFLGGTIGAGVAWLVRRRFRPARPPARPEESRSEVAAGPAGAPR